MTDRNIEDQERRCPRLGSVIPFSYCIISGDNDLPCWKILDCWWEIFDVEGYLKQNLPEPVFDELIKIAEKPKNKIFSIIEIAQQVKKGG